MRYRKTIQLPPSNTVSLQSSATDPSSGALLCPLRSFHGQGCGYHWWWKHLFFFLTIWWLLKPPYVPPSPRSTWTADLGELDLGVCNRHLMWRFCSLWAPFVYKPEKSWLGKLSLDIIYKVTGRIFWFAFTLKVRMTSSPDSPPWKTQTRVLPNCYFMHNTVCCLILEITQQEWIWEFEQHGKGR